MWKVFSKRGGIILGLQGGIVEGAKGACGRSKVFNLLYINNCLWLYLTVCDMN